ncbi:MAG: KH domain-containing protein [Candidatus Thermoplasmatota archaeon]|nr:KH domain-containing protein [Candidatus Thermoplasmatota archaeon]
MPFKLKVPQDRIGVLIGKDGETLRQLQDICGTRIEVDSENGEATLYDEETADTYKAFRMRDVIRAIGRGFSPEKAQSLLDDDLYYEEIDIREFSGKSPRRVMQVRARLIGSGGKTRTLVEELTDCFLSIKGNTVAIIGDLEGLRVAKKAITMILQGSEHSSVYSFLERKRKDLKIARWGF